MTSKVQSLKAFLADAGRVALVEVAGTKGSTPREKGAFMLVSGAASFGTIGGGQLEYMAIDKARQLLFSLLEGGEERSANGREKANDLAFSATNARSHSEGQAAKRPEGVVSEGTARASSTAAAAPPDGRAATLPSRGRDVSAMLDIPLGPEIGQCCGGRVEVLIRLVDAALARELVTAADAEAAQLPHVYIFGGGHVGQALASAVALLPVRVVVVETRVEALEGMPDTVETSLTPMPEAMVRKAPAGAAFVILTHDHALDFLIATEALKRRDAAYVGMIGSKTKKATFRSWFLKSADGSEAEFARLVSPIGGDAVKDKRPQVIAALAAAEIMMALAAHAMASAAPHPASRGKAMAG
ncbi:MAG: xanthine dehydrogenase accessory protein XdhC [Mesorhizobium sp.]|uniref:xanthine dehydrogenase accessory protein XdhC n=5 Tax=Mesorhizobium TaxID=68287 RepID=UPI000FCA24B5|nr:MULTISPECIES: xanthine dehydrogenase accessory protein XdhC [unclassified Mesorhizobium]RUV69893.1 xanthine dehydrogenase accessory protein XdhC [Mesorhizobium sp. M5C.F.Cr.IN.023.01.1.1]RWI37267.1 MAG: xanthine dehydrogenase accessory protein XdhC [Mesorhizobium sp.]RWI45141.1 MAG: xanthine dehydrogenase accessory protein XdhC [Mesorhizobium sp.]RWI55474.1 MAG: xanthine dehydrogenase accessory protein XdhC [Mesorhizobium sp.]RWI66715.1 MAG: xanthine dehydrogenase accessory protein XdhC [Me